MVDRSVFLLMILFSLSPLLRAAEGPKKDQPSLAKALVDDRAVFDGNRILDDLENNGMVVSHRITGRSGMEWPQGSGKYINFASGIWLAGKVQGELRLSAAEYGSEFLPGPYGTDPGDPDYRIYKISRTDLSVVSRNTNVERWPVDRGAPWVDTNGDGIYNVNDGDRPRMHGDQMLWYVMHDEADRGDSLYGAPPLHVEAQMTIWGYDRQGILGDMMFVKSLIINKGFDTLDSAYFGIWDDPDLGDAGDDFIGCDPTLNLAFCYNEGPDADYGAAPPALGYLLLQGPMVQSPGDSAHAYGQLMPGYRNLSMSSCLRFIKSTRNTATDPNDAQEAYFLLSGLDNQGLALVNFETGVTTRFSVADDPQDNTGRGDGIWVDGDDYSAGDRRFLMSSGPFTLVPGDSQEVVFAIIIAQGEDALDSVTRLKEAARLLQDTYTTTFPDLFPPWPAPRVAATPLRESIILNWDDGANASETFQVTDFIDRLPIPVAFDTTWTTVVIPVIDTLITNPLVLDTTYTWEQAIVAIDTTFRGEPTTFTFQGYNVYQLETASGQGAIERIATFDLIDGVTEIKDRVLHPAVGEYVDIRVQFGSDSGIRRSLLIEADELGGAIPLKINRAYYFAVTAYGHNPYGFPRTLESPLKVITVRPQAHNTLEPVAEADRSTIQAVHSTGRSGGSVSVKVVDPLAVTGDEYKVTFHNNPDSTAIVWDLTNTTTGVLLVDGNPIQSGVDRETGWEMGMEAGPIVDGLQVQVATVPNEFKDFYVTQNAAGAIAGNAGAAAEYAGYPGMGRDNIGNQQTDGSSWFISTSSGGDSDYEDFFPYVTRYSGGYGNPDGGMKYLVPDDFEFRFTANGGKMWEADAGVFIDVPMEVWNIGNVTDPADDFQLLPMFYDLDYDGNGEWNLYQADSPISGSNNDPYMEGFYVLEHMDRAPGSTGYDAMVAALTADPLASGESIWATGPGLELSVPGQITRAVLQNMTFVEWNGGDVADATWPANVTSLMPEEGTVFRMVTTKPNALSDVFTFTTDTLKAATLVYDPDRINVWPNPYFAYNPEERTPAQRIVMFTHLPETATIRIYNLGGLLVKILPHDDGSQYETWDLHNLDGRLVASGMYIVHIQTPYGDKVLKLAVVQAKD